jgi:gas vesicle protein
MKLVVGFLSGLVLGAVGAVAYSVQSGRDLREAFDEVRSDLSKRDLDALGARLESRVTEMQAQLETRIAQVRERAASAMDEATPVVTDAVDSAGSAAGEAAVTVEDAVAEAGETVAEAKPGA